MVVAKFGRVFLASLLVVGKGKPFSSVIRPAYSLSTLSSYLVTPKMATATDQLQRLENNAQVAEDIIADIYSKLIDIEKGPVLPEALDSPEIQQLRSENESLRLEVAKWKELLLLRQIRNGQNPTVTKCQNAGISNKRSQTSGLKENQANKSTPVMASPSAEKADNKRPTSAISTTSQSSNKKEFKSGTNLPRKPPVPKQQYVTPSPAKTRDSEVSVEASLKSTGSISFAHPPKDTDSLAASSVTNVPSTTSTATSSVASGTVGDVDVSKLDFKVGLITECERHPDADALYVEKIDLGEGKPRTIISGLVKHVPIEEMRNRWVVVLANLKPAKMRGILSEGMVMCASASEKVEILTPPTGSVAGDVIEVQGYPRNPEAVLNPKKKIWEAVAPDLQTNEKMEATYKGILWTVKGRNGPILAKTLANTQIK